MKEYRPCNGIPYILTDNSGDIYKCDERGSKRNLDMPAHSRRKARNTTRNVSSRLRRRRLLETAAGVPLAGRLDAYRPVAVNPRPGTDHDRRSDAGAGQRLHRSLDRTGYSSRRRTPERRVRRDLGREVGVVAARTQSARGPPIVPPARLRGGRGRDDR